MGKAGKSRRSLEKKVKKQAQKAQKKASYAALAGTGKKRGKRDLKADNTVRTERHKGGPCGNVGCSVHGIGVTPREKRRRAIEAAATEAATAANEFKAFKAMKAKIAAEPKAQYVYRDATHHSIEHESLGYLH